MEITKEQVLDIYNTNSFTYKRDMLEKWFPEAFKVEFEVGKWYFHDKSKAIVNYQGGSLGYGFIALKNWAPLVYNVSWSFETHAQEWRLATTEEWESALIEEAKRRGYKNGNYECLYMPGYTEEVSNDFFIENEELWIGDLNTGNMIFKDGVWAEIIKTFSKEEAEKLLGGKIILK